MNDDLKHREHGHARYVILTSRPGQYATTLADGRAPEQVWEYHYDGRHIATFALATVTHSDRVRVQNTTPDGAINIMPVKFMEKFTSWQEAIDALHVLTRSGQGLAQLHRQR